MRRCQDEAGDGTDNSLTCDVATSCLCPSTAVRVDTQVPRSLHNHLAAIVRSCHSIVW